MFDKFLFIVEAQTSPPPTQCDPSNVVWDDNREDPYYIGLGETYTMTSHADWDGSTNYDESSLTSGGRYSCRNRVCVSALKFQCL